MTDANRERTLERIRKMLRMAKGQGNAEEAAVAASMAEKTMRKYQISEAEVLVEQLDKGDVENVFVDNGTRQMPSWVDWIAFGVARANECEVTRGSGSHRFYGVGGDAQVAAGMLTYLVGEVNRLAKGFRGDRGEKGSFRRGCGSSLQSRLKEIGLERAAEFEQTSSGKELVVVKKALIAQSTGHKFKYSNGGRRYEGYGYREGRKAGDKVNLRKQVGGKGQARLA